MKVIKSKNSQFYSNAPSGSLSSWMSGFVDRSFKYLMIVPITVVLIAVAVFPFLYALQLSFTNAMTVNFDSPSFTGITNYISILTSDMFWKSVGITFSYVALALSLQIIIGVGLAILADKITKGRKWIVSLLITPMLISTVLAGVLFRLQLNPSFGIISYFADKIGLGSELLTMNNALLTVTLIDVWQWTSFIFLISFAGLKSLPVEPFEAAKVYNANTWQTIRYVTLPLLKPILMIAVIFRMMDTFKAFDHIYMLTAGGPGDATTTFSVLTYNYAYRADHFGRASAMAVIFLIIITIITKFIMKYLMTEKKAKKSA